MKCSYCSSEIEKGTGFAFVRKTGATKYFCSRRCYVYGSLQNRKISAKESAEE